MQTLFEECAKQHFLQFDDKDLEDILRKHGFAQPVENWFPAAMRQDISVHMSEDCATICVAYFGNCLGNFLQVHQEIDNLIIGEVQSISSYRTHWILKRAQEIGVCNTIVECGRRNSFRCADNEFVAMFVSVAKHYGEEIFLKTLKFTGTLPTFRSNLYSEVLNQVAEYSNKVNTRCCLGIGYCSCFRMNQDLYKEAESLLDEFGYESQSEVQELLLTKYQESVAPMIQKTYNHEHKKQRVT